MRKDSHGRSAGPPDRRAIRDKLSPWSEPRPRRDKIDERVQDLADYWGAKIAVQLAIGNVAAAAASEQVLSAAREIELARQPVIATKDDLIVDLFPTRVANALAAAFAATRLADLASVSESDLLRVPNLGYHTVGRIRHELTRVGLSLADEGGPLDSPRR